jgi:ribosomal protein S12 methylthiotransferase accessory factor
MTSTRESTLTIHEVGAEKSLITCRNGDRYLVDRPAPELLSLLDIALPHSPADNSPALSVADAEAVAALREIGAPPDRLPDTLPLPVAAGLVAIRVWIGSLPESLAGPAAELALAAGAVVDISPDLDLGADPVLVTVHWYPDRDELADLLARTAAAGRTWVPVVLRASEAVVGPAALPGHSGSVLDAFTRERAAAPVQDVAGIDYRRPVRARALTTTELAFALDRGVQEARRLAGGEPSRVAGNQLRIGFADLAETLHPVLPMPSAGMAPYRNDTLAGEDLIVDRRTGIVTRVLELDFPARAPAGIAGLVATAADLMRVGPWPNSIVNGSVAIDRPVAAMRGAAIGEAIERYCGNLPLLEGTRVASYRELRTAGQNAVDPAELVLFAEEQYARPGFRYVPFTADLPVRWVRGRSATRDAPVWVPAGVAWVNYHAGERAAEPAVNPPLFAGVAAGVTVEDAACAGLEEILERHATMVWWMHGRRLPLVGERTETAGRWPAWSLLVRNVFDLPVVATVVRDPDLDLATVGGALRPNLAECIAKSLAEGASNMVCNADLLDPDGVHWSGVRSGEREIGFFKPYRADRRYLDSFAPDFSDVGDLEVQLQVHCDPRATARALEILEPAGVADLDGLHLDFPRTLDGYRRIVERLGYEVIVVDLTTPDVAYAGYHVVRVVVPGLVSNFGAGLPLAGNGAIGRDGPRLGWTDTPLEPSPMNPLPLPHA